MGLYVKPSVAYSHALSKLENISNSGGGKRLVAELVGLLYVVCLLSCWELSWRISSCGMKPPNFICWKFYSQQLREYSLLYGLRIPYKYRSIRAVSVNPRYHALRMKWQISKRFGRLSGNLMSFWSFSHWFYITCRYFAAAVYPLENTCCQGIHNLGLREVYYEDLHCPLRQV